MTSIVPFATANVPAFAQAASAGNLSGIKFTGGGVNYKVVSIEGKRFTIKDGEKETILMNPSDPDTPAMYLECIILDVGPSADRKVNSKVWYLKGYEKGSKAKPDCFSNDGIAPDAGVAEPQATKCALCPKNTWGTGPNGSGTECRSSKRLVIATPDNLDEPMLLRVPATSITPLMEYFGWMQEKGVADTAHVVTRIGFDYTATAQKLTFKGLGWAPQDPAEAKAQDIVAIIAGKKAAPKAEVEEPFEDRPTFAKEAAPAPAPAPAPAEKPKAAAKPAPKDDDLPTEPKVKTEVKVEKPKAAAPAPAPVAVESDDDLDAAIGDLDFDN